MDEKETKYNDFLISNIVNSENTFFAVFSDNGSILDMNSGFSELLKKFSLVNEPKNIFITPSFDYFLSKIKSQETEKNLNVTIGTEKDVYFSLISKVKYSNDKFYFFGEINSIEINQIMIDYIILNNEVQNLNRKLIKNERLLQDTANELEIINEELKKDISERKLAEEKVQSLLAEKEIILREVNHRIKNNMNTLYGMLYLQADIMKDPAAVSALGDSANRVKSMMVLYDKLYNSPDVQKISVLEYLPTLVDEILANFPNRNLVKVEKKIDDFILHAKIMQPLGIIINELLTNIMKYAFTGRNDGMVIVSASLKENNVSIMIQDNGNGIPDSVDFENSTGFGLQLVWMLTKELHGTIRIERGNGTRIVLEFGM